MLKSTFLTTPECLENLRSKWVWFLDSHAFSVEVPKLPSHSLPWAASGGGGGFRMRVLWTVGGVLSQVLPPATLKPKIQPGVGYQCGGPAACVLTLKHYR